MNGSVNRPCPISESFISSSEFLTIEVRNTESTALRPLTFKLKYEFVDLHQDGVPANAPAAAASTQDVLDCDRKFVSSLLERKELHTFKSIRNVFFFGRGGNTNLTCTLKFEAQRGERVRVVIRKVRTGFNRTCGSKIDEDTDRSYCFGDSRIKVQVSGDPLRRIVVWKYVIFSCYLCRYSRSRGTIPYPSSGVASAMPPYYNRNMLKATPPRLPAIIIITLLIILIIRAVIRFRCRSSTHPPVASWKFIFRPST